MSDWSNAISRDVNVVTVSFTDFIALAHSRQTSGVSERNKVCKRDCGEIPTDIYLYIEFCVKSPSCLCQRLNLIGGEQVVVILGSSKYLNALQMNIFRLKLA